MIDRTISHYRILEKLGEGGMGVVYKAEDTKLERLVALKFLSPRALGTDEEKARFLHEAKSAAALNHPNICTVYAIDDADRETFIAMALIEGESLTAKITRGPLKLDEAIDLAVQVGEGLAAAHEKGIVHRDMKPGNVMVTAKGRAKIMDFGLAKSPGQTKLTRTGTTTGTVAYMSPEQSRGEGVDHRTDIWSFGVMLYEMIAGQRPFGGEYDQAIVYSIVNEDPEPITGLRTGVPLELERVVMKAMVKRPDERYQHIEDMIVDLRALKRTIDTDSTTPATVTRTIAAAAPSRARGRRIGIIVGAVAIAALAATFALVQLRGPGLELDPRRVVVVALENRTGDPSIDPLGMMIADWVAEGLSQIGDVEIASVGRPHAATDEGARGLNDMTRLRSLAEDAGAGVIVSGTYYAGGEDLRFQMRMMNAADGSITYAPPAVAGSRETATDDLEVLRQRIMGAVVTEFDPSLCSQPPMYEAYREFEIGMRIFAANYPECIRHLNRAIEIDPAFTSARRYLAFAHGSIGQLAKADSVMSELARNREKLAPFEQQLLGWYLAQASGDLEAGLRHLREARKLDPTDILATYLCGLYSLYVNRPREALDALDALPVFTEPEPDQVHWSWGYVATAHAHQRLGEHERELEIVRQGLEDYPDLPLLRASEVAALAALHRVDEVREIVDRSTAVASEYGSPFWVMEQAAQELRAHGHLEESVEIANRAVDWCRSRPVEEMETEELQVYLASALYRAERWDEARAVFEELAARSPDDFDYLGAIGTLTARQGDREEALRISAELEGLDRPHTFGTNIYWCACISAILGEKEQALAFLREAFSRGLQHYGHVDLHADMDLESLRDYPPFRELVRPKG